MIGSYLKTSSRNLMRNKLFSFINIVGLAISMSVGLLLIAFIMDLYSYDRFHINGDRIYRITHVATVNSELSGKFSTTSLKLGKLIRERVPGAEEVAIVHNDFSQDAKVGENILPIKGFWADPSLFKVFAFPMLEGNPEIALKEPYSIVVTETTAKKLFGSTHALGKIIQFDTLPYRVTGVMKDIPFFSHIHFEALVSLSTAEQLNKNNNYEQWANKWANYVYLLLPKNADKVTIQAQLDAIAKAGNIAEKNTKIKLELLPLYDLVVGENLSRSEAGASTGPHLPPIVLWIIGGLALIVILSACFNYTNLSIARAIRRLKEVGLRKAIGAGKNEIRQQFLIEAIIISLSALVVSFFLFLTLRPILINLAPEMQRTIKLELTPAVMIAFIIFSIFVGAIAGFLPALFFSKVSAMNAFRNATAPLSVKVFKPLNFRRGLVVIQYIFTLIFITTTAIGYVQYKNILAFDLGFNTKNILNIDTQGNRPEALLQELSELPEVKAISRSLIITSVGNAWGGFVKYHNTRDSALVMTNNVDENYLPLHEYKLIAGESFKIHPTSSQAASEMIVNQQFLKRFNISYNDPKKAIGEVVTFSNFRGTRKATIVGVMKDFHYGKVDNLIGPVAFMHWTPGDRTIINVKIQSMDMTATLGKIESIWKKYDRVHPLKAQFYEEAIEEAYSEFSMLIKIIGFLAFLAVSIASMGLFGMVVFTTETRLKEIGIRKVMGATAVNLIYILSRGFVVQLCLAALIALPLTYLFFKNFVLTHFPYHIPMQVFELFIGLLIVLLIAFIMIASQTIKAAKSNPVEVLKNE